MVLFYFLWGLFFFFMMIPADIIQQIKDRSDILEVVNDFVSLKKKGQNYTACCPFHNEKTPSFSVSQAKGIYKCFGCGKGGDSVSFVMDIENLSYPEALRWLAKKYQIEIPEDDKPLTDEQINQFNEKESIFVIHEFAHKYFIEQLKNTTEGQTIGVSYFKERDFRDFIIDKFGLGYNPTGWNMFSKAGLEAGFKEEMLIKSGLSLKTEKGTLIDRFRDRVMFPIFSVAGRVIGFGGRIMTNDKKVAKYLNSPETPIYEKSKVLYGLNFAKKTIREKENCYLVEGYTDVISLHQVDIFNVVSSSGTSLTIEQIRLLRRFTPLVTVLYDGDFAGIKASLRGIDLILEEGLDVKVLLFPDGEDPDSFSKKLGQTEFYEFLEKNTQDFITFKTNLFIKETANDPIKRAEGIKDIITSITKIPDVVKKDLFFQLTAKLLDTKEDILVSEAEKIIQKEKKKITLLPENQPQNQEENIPETQTENQNKEEVFVFSREEKGEYKQERELLHLMLNYGELELIDEKPLLFFILNEIADLSFHYPLYQKMLDDMRIEAKFDRVAGKDYFLNKENEAIKNLVAELLMPKYTISESWEKKFMVFTPQEKDHVLLNVQEVILRLKMFYILRMIKENEKNLKNAETEEEQDNCLMVGLKLEAMRKEIAKGLNNAIF
ncbi:MAG: DNA primase [Bacteroidetes bacterium]|nr:MAG: DNA primase [Bacteroidota bacterium]TAG85277.1 MAG: DNA primase [Bacteroidota bacterium]